MEEIKSREYHEFIISNAIPIASDFDIKNYTTIADELKLKVHKYLKLCEKAQEYELTVEKVSDPWGDKIIHFTVMNGNKGVNITFQKEIFDILNNMWIRGEKLKRILLNTCDV